jgi:hypothetical protein
MTHNITCIRYVRVFEAMKAAQGTANTTVVPGQARRSRDGRQCPGTRPACSTRVPPTSGLTLALES